MSAAHRLAVAVALALAAAPATAADPPAGQNVALPFPAKAQIVVHVHGHQRTKDRLLKTLEALPPAEGGKARRAIEDGIKKVLEGRDLSAVPGDGRWFVAVHDLTTFGDEQPAVAVLVPVTDFDKFKKTALTADERKTVERAGDGVEAFKSAPGGDEVTLYLAQVKGYAVVTPNKETAEGYAGKYTPAQSGSMGAELGSSFLNADVAVFVNMDVINDQFGDKIRQFKELIDFALGAGGGGGFPGLGKKQMEVVKTVFQGALQAVEDGKGVVLAAEFRPDGAGLRFQAQFAAESQSASMLKAEVPGPLTELGKLPKGLGAYVGSKFGSKFAALWGKLNQEFGAADDDDETAGRLEKLQAEVQAAGPGTTYSASTAPDTGLTITGYKDARKAAAALTGLYQAMPAGARVSSVVLKEKPVVKPAAQSHKGFTLAEVRVNFDFEATVESFPEPVREATLAQLKKLAAAKTGFWLGTDGKVVVQVVGKDWAAARALLDRYLSGSDGVAGDAGFQAARKNLPADASAVYLVETGELLTTLAEQAKTAMAAMPGGGPPGFGALKKPDGELTYLGFAVTLKGQVATAEVFVPSGAITAAARTLAPVFRSVE